MKQDNQTQIKQKENTNRENKKHSTLENRKHDKRIMETQTTSQTNKRIHKTTHSNITQQTNHT